MSFARTGRGAIERRSLGGGLSVSAISLGTAPIAVGYGPPGNEQPAPEREVALATIRAALDSGIDFVDTAPTYGNAEELVGAGTRERSCAIATKVKAGDDIAASLTTSLAMLGREHVDVLQLHNATAADVADRSLLTDLRAIRESGRATLVGATVYGEDDALAVIESGAFDCIQVAYSALDRRAERKVLPAAGARGVSVIARSALLRGVLTPAARDLPAAFAPLRDAADSFRRSVGAEWEELPGAAVAFALTRPGIATVLVGPRTQEELHSILEACARLLPRVRDVETPDPPEHLLDPRSWPREG